MLLPNEIIVALISVGSALIVMLIKDVALQATNERRTSQRTFLQARLEHAYAPLEYLSFMLLRTDNTLRKEQLTQEISAILQRYGHLLSEDSLSAFYVLLEDVNTGADILQDSFYVECRHLKRSYYRLWYSGAQRGTTRKVALSNQADNIYTRENYSLAARS